MNKEKSPTKYTDEYKNLRNINTMRENKKKREQKKPNMFPLKGLDLMAMFIEEQSRQMLENIAEDKFSTKEEREEFVDNYLKPNYFIPEVRENKKFEDLQRYM